MSFPQPSGSGTLTSIAQGSGVALSPNPIVNTGTVALATIPAGELFGNPGTVAAIGQGITIGNNISLSSTGTLSASGGGSSAFYSSPQIISGGPFATVNTGTGTVTNLLEFEVASTISAVDWPLNVTVNGDSYVASISPVNASNVVQSVTSSATITASGTQGAVLHFAFSPAVVCNTGTKYAFSCSDITALKTLPVHYNNARLYLRNSMQLGGTGHDTFQNTVTRIAVGTTLTGEGSGYWLMSVDIAP